MAILVSINFTNYDCKLLIFIIQVIRVLKTQVLIMAIILGGIKP